VKADLGKGREEDSEARQAPNHLAGGAAAMPPTENAAAAPSIAPFFAAGYLSTREGLQPPIEGLGLSRGKSAPRRGRSSSNMPTSARSLEARRLQPLSAIADLEDVVHLLSYQFSRRAIYSARVAVFAGTESTCYRTAAAAGALDRQHCLHRRGCMPAADDRQ